jgi:hypothetical protein
MASFSKGGAMTVLAASPALDVTDHWYWEGNVVRAVKNHLLDAGWEILSEANTYTKERGVDLHARRSSTNLLVEAKGYPSTSYRDPKRAGEQKPTNPTNQAQHWYSHALLKAMRLQTANPGASVALAFPDFPRYRVLFAETQGALAKLAVAVLFVNEDGIVRTWGLEQDI